MHSRRRGLLTNRNRRGLRCDGERPHSGTGGQLKSGDFERVPDRARRLAYQRRTSAAR